MVRVPAFGRGDLSLLWSANSTCNLHLDVNLMAKKPSDLPPPKMDLLLDLRGEQFRISAPSDATWGWVLSHAIRLVGEPASGPVWVGLHCKYVLTAARAPPPASTHARPPTAHRCARTNPNTVRKCSTLETRCLRHCPAGTVRLWQ